MCVNFEVIMKDGKYRYLNDIKLINVYLAFFGMAASPSGELAKDGGASVDHLIHSYLGL
jgi:hypothetical protein